MENGGGIGEAIGVRKAPLASHDEFNSSGEVGDGGEDEVESAGGSSTGSSNTIRKEKRYKQGTSPSPSPMMFHPPGTTLSSRNWFYEPLTTTALMWMFSWAYLIPAGPRVTRVPINGP